MAGACLALAWLGAGGRPARLPARPDACRGQVWSGLACLAYFGLGWTWPGLTRPAAWLALASICVTRSSAAPGRGSVRAVHHGAAWCRAVSFDLRRHSRGGSSGRLRGQRLGTAGAGDIRHTTHHQSSASPKLLLVADPRVMPRNVFNAGWQPLSRPIPASGLVQNRCNSARRAQGHMVLSRQLDGDSGDSQGLHPHTPRDVLQFLRDIQNRYVAVGVPA